MVTPDLKPPASDGEPEAARGLRVYAIGDVHGHLDKLQALHRDIAADLRRDPAPALLVHLGDLIDRGPQSAGCVALLAAGPPLAGVPTVNLMGNHEWMLLSALTEGDEAVAHWLANGGGPTLDSWGIAPDTPASRWRDLIPAAQLRFLHRLAMHHRAAGCAFVHAGVRPGVALEAQRADDLLWIRAGFLDWEGVMLPESPGLRIVHGHTPRPEPVVRPNRIGIDTGAGKGGPVTCAVLDAGPLQFLAA